MGKKKKYGIRTFINDVHLWLGLVSGIILFLVCLSGTILTFEKEIEGWFKEKLTVEATGPKKSLSSLVNDPNIRAKGTITGMTIPTAENSPYQFSIKEDPKQRRGTTYEVNPYTAEVLAPKETGMDKFMFSMFRMHRWLMMDIKWGRPIVGIATIIFLILAISGIVLWFPKKVKWKTVKSGFKIKTNANWKRINHDLHNTLGFYSCILILIMGITGLCWSFEGYRDGLSAIMGTRVFGNRGGQEVDLDSFDNGRTINLEEAIAIANRELNYEGTLTVSLPNEKNPVYGFRKLADDSWSTVAQDRLNVHQSGQVISKDIYADKPLNVKIASAIKPIHTGTIYGGFSKWLYFLACLIGTSLPVTGTIIYINKLKKKRKRRRSLATA
ncbi:PepSY-associated TM helix domain-containing protein [Flagellimonas okinawensis]|uniref:PepSY-associated TM helix domain-containing protein n=1 Tax=Flagellimonas okinawensis TaxID=3031324 RepID=A0ABT5XLP0_9FLAO|nr:PepSY-associated TM helix domain-containing protein [[Muricauda] okinawensis]MDF0706737.1 PepSY-associated TM helix domain-containing protein [[Muricauda] okinawensis]